MTKLKKFATLGTIVLVIGAMPILAAASSTYNKPAEMVAELVGRTSESIIAEKAETGKSYGTIAKEAGKLEEFKNRNHEIKKVILAEKVAQGTMTQEKADEIITAIEANKANCDGTGSAKIGKEQGAGFCKMNGSGQGQGKGGARRGQGEGQGMRNGTCIAE